MLRRASVVLVLALASFAAACGPAPTPAPAPAFPKGTGAVIAGFKCPVVGSRYTDDYGPRGTSFHYGIDMLIGLGANIYSPMAGTVHYVPNEGAGGNVAYLKADDGNVYMMAHMNDFVGGDRRVIQSEVVGHVGMTGNATAPHLHFEIRLGGINGTRMDPYATLRSAGC